MRPLNSRLFFVNSARHPRTPAIVNDVPGNSGGGSCASAPEASAQVNPSAQGSARSTRTDYGDGAHVQRAPTTDEFNLNASRVSRRRNDAVAHQGHP